MNATTPEAKSLEAACRNFLKDLRALPEQAFRDSLGGKARTVADIVYETNLVNDHVGMVVRGEEPFDWPEDVWIRAPAGFSTKAQVIEAFERSSERIVGTFNDLTAEDLAAPLETDEGVTTRAERGRFMALHLWYHAGQLNYIQTLLGDDVWHWPESAEKNSGLP